MTRQLHSHAVNPANEELSITVVDEPGSGGASHLYMIEGFNTATNRSDPFVERHGAPAEHATILFQNGAIKEHGVNGITHEALLAILIDRLESFQAGQFACPENAEALRYLGSAQETLLARTRARMARGVEGRHIP